MKRFDYKYFDLKEILSSSKTFEFGSIKYRLIKTFDLSASRVFKVIPLNGKSEALFIKILENRSTSEFYKHQKIIKNEYMILRDMFNVCNENNNYSVLTPVECIQDKLALITKEEIGRRLDHFLLSFNLFTKKNFDLLSTVMFNTGRWLDKFYHHFTKNVEIIHYYQHYLDIFYRNFAVMEKHLSYDIMNQLKPNILKYVEKIHPIFSNANILVSLCHGDFSPGNTIFNNNGKIFVFDFSDSHQGVIYNDLSKYFQWIDEIKLRRFWHNRLGINSLKDSLIKGFCVNNEFSSELFSIFRFFVIIGKIANLSASLKRQKIWSLYRTRYLRYLIKELEALY